MLTKPLKQIVADFLLSADLSDHAFTRIYHIGRRCIENEFNLDIMGGFRTVVLDINPNKTVEIPTWCTKFSKIGLINEIGEIVPLKLNDQLNTYHGIYFNQTDRLAGLPRINNFSYSDAVPTGYPYGFGLTYLNFYSGGTSFNLYGASGGTPTIGRYNIDIQNGIIVIDSKFPYSQVVFEGMTDGFDDETGDYMIPIDCAEAMVYWLRWQNMADLPKKYPASLCKNARREYYNEKRKSKVRINPANITDLQNAERASWKLVAKA